MRSKILVPITATALLLAVASAPMTAKAGDIQGDAYNCDELWVMKNEIYKQRGYCFKTTKAITKFGNAGCLYDEQADVPLSDNDRAVLKDIKLSMARQAC